MFFTIITLINPSSPFLLNQKSFVNLGLLTIGAYLQKLGWDVDVIDLAGKDEIKKNDVCTDASLIGISSTTPQYHIANHIFRLIWLLKEESNREIPVVVGGPGPTVDPNAYKNSGFDLTVMGEGEIAMNNIAIAVKAGLKLIPQIVHPIPVSDFDVLPHPNRDLISMEEYNYEIDGFSFTNTITSRGCPYKCAFCCSVDEKMRMHSATWVIRDINKIRNYGFDGVMFFDDVFTLNSKRLLKICEYMKKEKMIYRCFVRGDTTRETLKLLADTGCIEVGVGVESGSQKILDTIKKGVTVEQNMNLVKNAHEFGIKVKAFTIFGLPGENRSTIKETEKWLLEAKPDAYDITIFTPYPGSDIYNNPDDYAIDWEVGAEYFPYKAAYTPGYRSMVWTPDLTAEELDNLREEVDLRVRDTLGIEMPK